jgi:hypothetical protein
MKSLMVFFGDRQKGAIGKYASAYLNTGGADLVTFGLYSSAGRESPCHIERGAEESGLSHFLTIEETPTIDEAEPLQHRIRSFDPGPLAAGQAPIVTLSTPLWQEVRSAHDYLSPGGQGHTHITRPLALNPLFPSQFFTQLPRLLPIEIPDQAGCHDLRCQKTSQSQDICLDTRPITFLESLFPRRHSLLDFPAEMDEHAAEAGGQHGLSLFCRLSGQGKRIGCHTNEAITFSDLLCECRDQRFPVNCGTELFLCSLDDLCDMERLPRCLKYVFSNTYLRPTFFCRNIRKAFT